MGIVGRTFGRAACALSVGLLVAALLLAGRARAGELGVSAAQVRLAAVAGRPAAGYFTLRGGGTPDTLTAVTSPLATRVELHSTSMAGGVMRMAALPEVAVAAGATVSFGPGGKHLMIYGLPATLKPGATVPLVLRFKSGKTLRADAVAAAPGAAMEMAAEHGAH